MEDSILNLRSKKYSINKIAKELKLSTIRVTEVLKKNNLVVSPNRIKEKPSKHKIDVNFFKTINTEQKAYVLGFLYADGYLNKNKNVFQVSLTRSDSSILQKILECMDSNYPLYYGRGRYSKEYKETEKVILSICNKNMYNDLLDKGMTPSKSLTLKFPSPKILPKKLQHHFMRGYFDGDGTIYKEKQNNSLRFGIISTLEFCNSFLELLPCDKVTVTKEYRSEKNVYYFVVNKKDDIKRIYHFLYKNASIFLERKKEKFEDSSIK